MKRQSLLLVCSLVCSTAYGFPAPKPKEPPTSAELIVGRWEAVVLWGDVPEQPTQYEFMADGKLIITAAGKAVETKKYKVGIGPFDGDGEVVCLFISNLKIAGIAFPKLQSVSGRELVLGDGKAKSVFKRK